jgi:hypothetical protein
MSVLLRGGWTLGFNFFLKKLENVHQKMALQKTLNFHHTRRQMTYPCKTTETAHMTQIKFPLMRKSLIYNLRNIPEKRQCSFKMRGQS